MCAELKSENRNRWQNQQLNEIKYNKVPQTEPKRASESVRKNVFIVSPHCIQLLSISEPPIQPSAIDRKLARVTRLRLSNLWHMWAANCSSIMAIMRDFS